MEGLRKEYYLNKVRARVRKDNIKLWLPPYVDAGKNVSIAAIQNLADSFARTSKIPYEIYLELLVELQQISSSNLAQRELFETLGLAVLKLKIINEKEPIQQIEKQVSLKTTPSTLKCELKSELNTNKRLNIISAGKILNDDITFEEQEVKTGQKIVVVVLSDPQEGFDKEQDCKDMETAKSDTSLLSLDQEYMTIEDQSGKLISMPLNEKKAMMVGMALHEKGKAAMKKKDYSRALIFLLEAHGEFKKCDPKIFDIVDNYALLDLDIAWCYLRLDIFIHLPSAATRLKKCEEKFKTIYGPKMERVKSLKGSSGNEEALLVRLYLLQAVVLYRQNQKDEALALLKHVREKLRVLVVDKVEVAALMNLGYTECEARIGLRATGGSVGQAQKYIEEDRKKKLENAVETQLALLHQVEDQKYGLCDDGLQYINPNYVSKLVTMGYSEQAAKLALQRTNNVIGDSVEYIEQSGGPSTSDANTTRLSAINRLIPELVGAGFDPRMAKIALENHDGDVLKAAEELLTNDGVAKGDLSHLVSHSSAEQMKKQRAYQRLSEDITSGHDEYLDIDLTEEQDFLLDFLELFEE